MAKSQSRRDSVRNITTIIRDLHSFMELKGESFRAWSKTLISKMVNTPNMYWYLQALIVCAALVYVYRGTLSPDILYRQFAVFLEYVLDTGASVVAMLVNSPVGQPLRAFLRRGGLDILPTQKPPTLTQSLIRKAQSALNPVSLIIGASGAVVATKLLAGRDSGYSTTPPPIKPRPPQAIPRPPQAKPRPQIYKYDTTPPQPIKRFFLGNAVDRRRHGSQIRFEPFVNKQARTPKEAEEINRELARFKTGNAAEFRRSLRA